MVGEFPVFVGIEILDYDGFDNRVLEEDGLARDSMVHAFIHIGQNGVDAPLDRNRLGIRTRRHHEIRVTRLTEMKGETIFQHAGDGNDVIPCIFLECFPLRCRNLYGGLPIQDFLDDRNTLLETNLNLTGKRFTVQPLENHLGNSVLR